MPTDKLSHIKKIGKKKPKENEDARFFSKNEMQSSIYIGILNFLEGRPYSLEALDEDINPPAWDIWFYRTIEDSSIPDWDRRPHETLIYIFHKKTRTVREISKQDLENEIIKATNVFFHPVGRHKRNGYVFGEHKSKEMARIMMSIGRSISYLPPQMGFVSDAKWVHFRHPWDPDLDAKEEDFPTINNIRNSITTNLDAFDFKLGAAYHPESDIKQMIYLRGIFGGGKSAVFDLVTKCAGGTYAIGAIGSATFNSSHGLEILRNKRFIIGEEIESWTFFKSLFKQITGGGPALINPKGSKMIVDRFKAHVWLSSNDTGTVPDDPAVRYRLIICSTEQIKNKLKRHEADKKMADELSSYVGYCISKYRRIVKKQKGLTSFETPDNKPYDEMVLENNDILYEVIGRIGEFDPTITLGHKECPLSSDVSAAINSALTLSPIYQKIKSPQKRIKNLIKEATGNTSRSWRVLNSHDQVRYCPGFRLKFNPRLENIEAVKRPSRSRE